MATKRLRVGTETDEESMVRGGVDYIRVIRRDLAHRLANEIERSGMLTIREEPVFDQRSIRITADIEVVDPAVSGSSQYTSNGTDAPGIDPRPSPYWNHQPPLPPQAYRSPFPTIPPRNDVPLKEVKELLARMTEMKGLIREETSGQYVIGLMVDQLTALVDKFDRPAAPPQNPYLTQWGPVPKPAPNPKLADALKQAMLADIDKRVTAARAAGKRPGMSIYDEASDLARHVLDTMPEEVKRPVLNEARSKLIGQIKTRAT